MAVLTLEIDPGESVVLTISSLSDSQPDPEPGEEEDEPEEARPVVVRAVSSTRTI
jgi:hypothetical protein